MKGKSKPAQYWKQRAEAAENRSRKSKPNMVPELLEETPPLAGK